MQEENDEKGIPFPNGSESFGTVRSDSEGFRSVPKLSERNENHTLIVRQVARMFEVAGVARTERSIINWCQVNAQGVARLDAHFDPNERKYFITPQSVEQAIAEEQARAAHVNTVSDAVRSVANGSEAGGKRPTDHSQSNSESVATEKGVVEPRN